MSTVVDKCNSQVTSDIKLAGVFHGIKQEAQLMLTNPCDTFTGLVKVTKHGTIQYVRYGPVRAPGL